MKNSCSSACAAMNWIVCLVLFLTTLASLAGVYQVLFGGGGATFGSSNGSLALIALAINLMLWSKTMCRCLCSCEQ
ncbi:MAG: hypothetical protein PHE68_04330 [Candidatus Peribacteraceae bacterium]|nr:hypothetical protein [Candidatus Peribacteraceae bacterium]MDD5075133.1 hypothetical protein [Candidatus Peribacteraceae bacterium]